VRGGHSCHLVVVLSASMRAALSLFSLLLVSAICVRAQTSDDTKPYQEVFYQSGKLRIQAYLYKPAGDGPFPVVIYNHGSRDGRERIPTPFIYVGRMLTTDGFVVLVPERRGYGKSDGRVFRDEVGADTGERFVSRLQDETGDVFAAMDFLKTLPFTDTTRVGIMGWSLGGIISVFAASRSSAFKVVVDQAGAALSWERNSALRQELVRAAGRIKVPLMAMDAENDRTTEAVKAVVREVEKNKVPAKLVIYPAYTPPEPPGLIAPGHLIFGAAGAHIWESDVRAFLAGFLAGAPS
jgi:dienelactone hydrolase